MPKNWRFLNLLNFFCGPNCFTILYSFLYFFLFPSAASVWGLERHLFGRRACSSWEGNLILAFTLKWGSFKLKTSVVKGKLFKTVRHNDVVWDSLMVYVLCGSMAMHNKSLFRWCNRLQADPQIRKKLAEPSHHILSIPNTTKVSTILYYPASCLERK